MIDLNLKVPYMTREELASFQKDRRKNDISMFRVRLCVGIHDMDGPAKARACVVEIPRVDGETDDDEPLKRYCSVQCFENNEHVKRDDDDKEEW